MRGTRLVGTTLLVAGILAAASPPAAALRVEVPPNRKRVDQPPAGPCASLTRNIPPGAWVLHRAPDGKRLLRVH